MAVNSSNDMKNFLTALGDIEGMLAKAPKVFVFSDKCSLDRTKALELINQLRAYVPGSVSAAEQILEDEEKIRTEAAATATQTVEQAKAEAAQIVAAAKQELDVLNQRIEESRREVEETLARGKQQAQQQMQQANADAENIIQSAKQQAQQIVNAGEARAQELMTQENVYRRAEISANEMLANANNEMATLRANTFSYLDDMLGQAEKYMSGLVNDLQQERNSVNSAR